MTTASPAFRPRTYTYSTGLTWQEGRAGMLEPEGKPPSRVASPPEFKVEPGTWTPEDLFVAAVESCTMTTFLALSTRGGLPLLRYESSAEGKLEWVDGGFRFTVVTVRPRVTVSAPDAVQAARDLLEDAHRRCLIGKSIQATVELEPEVRVGEPSPS